MNYKTTVYIDGKTLTDFELVTLKQQINDHHEFKVIVDHDAIEKIGTHTLEASKAWLGKAIVIGFDAMEFLGVVTNVKMVHTDGHQGDIEVSGYSKTILLEQGEHTFSWLNKSLYNIVKDTVEITNIQAQIQPKHTRALSYESQYGESHFKFLQRLAKQHNEWLYYDGIKLVFGKPTISEVTSLEYGRELTNISIGINASANSYNIFSYNSLYDTKNEGKTKNDVEGLNELGMEAFNTSLEIFNTIPNSHSVVRTKDKGELESALKNKQAAAVADLNVLEADCNVQNLTVGSIIKISSAMNLGKAGFDIKNYGEYLIIEITHEAASTNTYTCHFKAIPSGVAILPEPKVSMPKANIQMATVVSNEDPQGKGRVEVQFQWQKYEQKTAWLRVMTPDAGQSEHHAQNRGHVFIPEEGDQVMVGFRYGDPNRPFVMGSVFNGTTGAGGKNLNTHKSIITRSGHVIEFNDTDKQESITITDKNKNIIFIDTANKNIKISAPETIDIEAKNINIRAEEKIYMQSQNMETQVGEDKIVGVGNNLEVTAESSYTLNTTEHTETIEGSKKVDIQSSLSVNSSEAEIIAGNGDINIQGSGIATVQGGQDVKVSKG